MHLPSKDPCTNSIPDLQELHSIVKQMRNNATLGPDGLNATFYKMTWPQIQQDVHNLVTHFYSSAHLPDQLNQTYIALIPKKVHPVIPQDFRPISLCNVIYKIIAKSLADRVKPHLPHSINLAQAAFIKNRYISSNIIITQEIIHSFNLKSWNQKAFILKLDLAKAFDRLEWDFIEAALRCQGYKDNFIRLIHACISTPTFSVLLNGEPSAAFRSQ